MVMAMTIPGCGAARHYCQDNGGERLSLPLERIDHDATYRQHHLHSLAVAHAGFTRGRRAARRDARQDMIGLVALC
jgi:hypothetical protein